MVFDQVLTFSAPNHHMQWLLLHLFHKYENRRPDPLILLPKIMEIVSNIVGLQSQVCLTQIHTPNLKGLLLGSPIPTHLRQLLGKLLD